MCNSVIVLNNVRNGQRYCKLYTLIYDPNEKMWIFEFSLGMCSMELHNFVSSLNEYCPLERALD